MSGAGCNATPPSWACGLFKLGVVDTRSRLWPKPSAVFRGWRLGQRRVAPPGAERVRPSYKPTGHRHIAEMEQELGHTVHFSLPPSRWSGNPVTAHLFVKEGITEKDIWKSYREVYSKEPSSAS